MLDPAYPELDFAMYQRPSDGRNIARSDLPSPSKSRRIDAGFDGFRGVPLLLMTEDAEPRFDAEDESDGDKPDDELDDSEDEDVASLFAGNVAATSVENVLRRPRESYD